MALLERVGTLLRANINDLISKAEDPEKLARQLVLDMENQLLQVKTQVAIAIADQHLLHKKKKEHEDAMQEWHRKAELAVSRQQDDLARAALGRSLSHQNLANSFTQQLEDQTTEAETLRSAFAKLQQKLQETQSTAMLLPSTAAPHDGWANAARTIAASPEMTTLDRLRPRFNAKEAANAAATWSSRRNRLTTVSVRWIERIRLSGFEDLKSRQPRLTTCQIGIGDAVCDPMR
jgi:phage shock protein A